MNEILLLILDMSERHEKVSKLISEKMIEKFSKIKKDLEKFRNDAIEDISKDTVVEQIDLEAFIIKEIHDFFYW